jgi:predicted ATPase/DNA-binding SARP family transcriptional activator
MGSTPQVSVLGPVRLMLDGRDRTPRGALQRRLLCALALRASTVARAGELADLLWPAGLPADHQAALQTHVFRLRRLLPDRAISTTPSGYRLELGPEGLDAACFEAAIYDAASLRARDPEAAALRLAEALGWWRGTPYDEVAELDDARIEAARLTELRIRAVEERFDCLLELGHHVDMLADLQALAAHEPLRERPQALLMVALQRSGRRADALAVFDRFRRALASELGIDPSAGLRELHDAVVTDEVPAPASSVASPSDPVPTGDRSAVTSPPPATTGEVPRFTSSFVGRDDLVGEIVDRLDSERLVTLLGTGGIGKTRVAVEVAGTIGEGSDGAVWFCELAAADPTSVIITVATATAVDERAGGGLLDRIVDVLQDKRGLLVVDNCEHVLDAVAEVAEAVLAGAPAVRILATSRERLAVEGEHLCPVPPLPRPSGGEDEPAVRLFVDRARAVQPAWRPAGADVAQISEVCRRLDGLPLAIELAAARLHTLTLDEVASGLETRFRLLTGGRRTTARHRSLAAAVGWSYELLGEQEREMFDAVAMFQSPFRAAAAGDLLGWNAPDATDVLSRLVERSLLYRTGTRYGMLESLRHFGAARLDERARTHDLRRRHAHHHVAFAEASRDRLRVPGQLDVFDELDASLADLRATQRYLLDAGDRERLLRFTLALRDYGYYRLRPEVLGWAEAAADLALEAGRDPRIADAFAIAALEAWNRGEHERGKELARRGRAVMDEAGQPTYYLLGQLGNHAMHRGRLAEATEWADAAHRTHTAQHDELLRIESHGLRALVRAYAGDPATAADVAGLLDSLHPRTPEVAASWAWYVAGESVIHDDPPLATERLRRSAVLARSCGASFLLGIAGASAASIEARYGDPAEAVAQYRWLLDHWQRAGIRVIQWNMLRAVAELLVRTGRLRPATVLLGALTSTDAGHAVYGEDSHRLAAVADAVRRGLGSREHHDALAEGRLLDDDGAVAVALAAFDQLS